MKSGPSMAARASSPRGPRRSRWRVLRLPAALLGLGGVLLGAIALTPLPDSLSRPTPATLSLLDKDGALLAQVASPAARLQIPVPLEQMGLWLPGVTVALEDRRFRSHHGVDARGLLGSIWRNVRHGRVLSGGSTITQQVIKQATGRQGRSWGAKLYEAAAALKLEWNWSKDRILAEYLNRGDYGNRLLGAEAAARTYFGKPAHELTLAEAIYLAGLPQAPTRFNPWSQPARAAARYARAVATLRGQGFLPAEQAARLAETTPTAGRHLPERRAPHFVATVLRQKPGLVGSVRTSLDLRLQERAEELVRTHLRLLHRHDVTCASVVILQNSTGAVRAMVGSPDFTRTEMNQAMATHSAGSTLKPFLYLKAIEERVLTAASVLPDTAEAIREAYDDYDPQDYTKRYLGPVRVREALACSLNVPAVVALRRTGARAVFFDLQRWGFAMPHGLDDYGAGFILGNAEVRPLDLAAAYAGLARGGLSVTPAFLSGGRGRGSRIVSRESAAIVTDILCDNAARARGFGAHSPLALSRRVAAKTGTSSGFRDAWTAGFTRDHTVVVWVGNADGRPMREAFSIRAAAPLWAAIMDELLRDDPGVEPPMANERLAAAAVRALPSGEEKKEWFLAGTSPDESVAYLDGGEKTRLVLPREYGGWCASGYNSIGAVCPAAEKLAITQPADRARFLVDDALPRQQQRLELACAGGPGRAVRWFVNGTEITGAPDGRVFWPLAAGAWEIQAEAEGEKATVAITVE